MSAENEKDPRTSLPIDIGTELLIEIVNIGQRIKGVLTGFEYGSYVIIRISPKDLVGNFRSEDVLGSPLIVRYLFKGSVYGFKTSISNTVSSPARMLFTRYPEKIEGMNIRTNPRYSCILPGRTKIGEDVHDTVVVDISAEGCRCMIKRPAESMEALFCAIDANKSIGISIDLPGTSKPVEIKSTVRNISKENDRVTFGVSLDSMQPDDKTSIIKFVSLISDAGVPA